MLCSFYVRAFVDRFVKAFRVSCRIPGRACHDNLTPETAIQGPKAVTLAGIEAPAQPTGASKSLTHILVAMPSRHDQSTEVFEVVNTSVEVGMEPTPVAGIPLSPT